MSIHHSIIYIKSSKCNRQIPSSIYHNYVLPWALWMGFHRILGHIGCAAGKRVSHASENSVLYRPIKRRTLCSWWIGWKESAVHCAKTKQTFSQAGTERASLIRKRSQRRWASSYSTSSAARMENSPGTVCCFLLLMVLAHKSTDVLRP